LDELDSVGENRAGTCRLVAGHQAICKAQVRTLPMTPAVVKAALAAETPRAKNLAPSLACWRATRHSIVAQTVPTALGWPGKG